MYQRVQPGRPFQQARPFVIRPREPNKYANNFGWRVLERPAQPERRQIWSETSDQLLTTAERDSILSAAQQFQAREKALRRLEEDDGRKSYLCVNFIQDGFCAQAEMCRFAHSVLELGEPVPEKKRAVSNTSDYHSEPDKSNQASPEPAST